jgi:hypothetical protein
MLKKIIALLSDLAARKYSGRLILHFHLGCISKAEKLDEIITK